MAEGQHSCEIGDAGDRVTVLGTDNGVSFLEDVMKSKIDQCMMNLL